MIKRTTAIVFMMLASILILAHAVVPHHHHNKLVCLTNSHCINESFTDEHVTNHDNHSHDGENNSDDCVLKEPVIVLPNQLKTEYKFTNATDHSGLDGFHYSLLKYSTEFLIPFLSSFYYEQFPDSSYIFLVSASLGLRAPPVV